MSFKIPLIKPYIDEEIISKVKEVLLSGYLTQGPVTKEFEKSISNYVGSKFGISFTSNTTGMETALRSFGIGKGDEVIVPGYTYPATASVVSIVGAEPVFVDVDINTANIDYSLIEESITDKTKAIIPVSLFGNALDYSKLNRIKKKYNLIIIEDSACSLGSSYEGIMTGNLADASIFSFHPRKFITTGEGGMLTTNNEDVALSTYSYKYFGLKTWLEDGDIKVSGNEFSNIGTNYKLTNLQASIGLVQMKHIGKLLEERRKLAKNYDNLLKDLKDVLILKTTPNSEHSYQSYGVVIQNRDKIINEMRNNGIEVQIGSIDLLRHKAFSNFKHVSNLENSKLLGQSCMVLPLYNGMTKEQQESVVNELRRVTKLYS